MENKIKERIEVIEKRLKSTNLPNVARNYLRDETIFLKDLLDLCNSSLQLKKKRETNSQTWEEISIEELKERIRK